MALDFEIDEKLRENLIRVSVRVERPADTELFHQGEPAKGAYFILSGSINLFLDGQQRKRLLVRQTGPGDVVGLPATVNRADYSLTAETLSACSLGFIRVEELTNLVAKNPSVGLGILH